jgi:hypothetical protein
VSAAPDPTPIHTELTAKALLDTVFPAGNLDDAIDDQLARWSDPEPSIIECPNCDGQGWIDVRQFGRHAEDEYVSQPCAHCGATGEVRAR